jgi:hypothetical protein
MSVIATKQYLTLRRGNVTWTIYFDLHGTAEALAALAAKFLEIAGECKLRKKDGSDIPNESTFEEAGITVSGTEVILVARNESGEWEDLPLHEPESALHNPAAIAAIKAQQEAKNNTTATAPATPSSSTSC